jgi:hypothetical protein
MRAVPRNIDPALIRRYAFWALLLCFGVFHANDAALAHGVTTGDKGFIQESSGVLFTSFVYLGAKHMITGYDHILFLVGIVFFLYRMKDVTTYVSLFALGHIVTLLAGVYFDLPINAYVIDAIIGFSVVYKGFDNIGGFERLGIPIDTKKAVAVFGLFHGLGLAAKIQEYELSSDGLVWNLLSFNVGVEIGQILALAVVLIGMAYWRRLEGFRRQAHTANTALMAAGFTLMGYQVTGLLVS